MLKPRLLFRPYSPRGKNDIADSETGSAKFSSSYSKDKTLVSNRWTRWRRYNTSPSYFLLIGPSVKIHFYEIILHYHFLARSNLENSGFKLELQYDEAVMSESGIFLVSIPRPSMHTWPGTSVKPVHRNKKKHRTQLLEALLL